MAILGAIILCIIVYFKFYRKFKRMKTELAHVHYIADPIQNGKYIVNFNLKFVRFVVTVNCVLSAKSTNTFMILDVLR